MGLDSSPVDDYRGKIGVEGTGSGEVKELKFGYIEATRMLAGPAGGVVSLGVEEVMGFGHGWSTGKESGVVYETGLLVVLAGFGESEKVGRIEEIEDRGEGGALWESVAGRDGWGGIIVEV